MRVSQVFLAALSVAAMAVPAYAQTSQAGAPNAKSAPAPKYSTADTELGILLDDPKARAIVEKHIPGLTTNDQIEMARPMTLKAIQQYAPDEVTDERLAAIDADFAKLGDAPAPAAGK